MLFQNNLERQEYETKSRLTSQIDGLEQEVTVLKQKLTSEQNQSSKLIETLQVCKLMNINHLYYFRHPTSAVKILTYNYPLSVSSRNHTYTCRNRNREPLGIFNIYSRNIQHL